jgi:hypothetical protein
MVDKDYSFEVRKMRSELASYLRDAKSRRHTAFIRGGRLFVDGRLYDLQYLKLNIQIGNGDQWMDCPSWTYPVKAQEMAQQVAVNKETRELGMDAQ